jgi:hypothetical protein
MLDRWIADIAPTLRDVAEPILKPAVKAGRVTQIGRRPDADGWTGEPHRWEMRMNMRRDFLLFVTLAAAAGVVGAATPAVAQTAAPAVGPADGATYGAASIPDFSRVWNHPSFPWFEPPASGPGPVTNRSRWPHIVNQQPPVGGPPGGSPGLPPSKDGQGVSDYDQLVGDYTNPILQPWAAAVVKKFGEISLAGITYPNPSNQCWPEPVPFIFKRLQTQMIQQADKITILYGEDHEVRWVRLNQPHPTPVTPSWHGDSVGHYEGDTLVIDTIGVRTDHPYAMIDLFGTPYTKSLHVVERYRLRDYDDVRDAIERNLNENWLPGGDVFSQHRGKFLQLDLTIEDVGVFTAPWTATLTYVPARNSQLLEDVCAENVHQYYYNNEANVPRAEKPDF